MASIKIDQRQLDALTKKLGSLAKVQQKLRPTMARSVLKLQADMSFKPPKEIGAWSRPESQGGATKKQKAAFWARVNAGDIRLNASGSYIRTGASTKWTNRIFVTRGGLVGVVGNNANAAPFIYGAPPPPGTQQSWLTKWPRVDKVFDDRSDEIEDDFNRAIERELAK